MTTAPTLAPTATGKNKDNENFPVGSLLIAPALRPHIHAFYKFARLGDDIADDPLMEPAEKIRRLNRLDEVLTSSHDPGTDAPAALGLRDSLRQTGISNQHARDLLTAFKQDAVKRRYASWQELLDYCRYSASPVGRYVLALHGYGAATWPASDALCTALQILNHLQDCATDYAENDRVYLPHDMAHAAGADFAALAAPASNAPLLLLKQNMLAQLAPLLQAGRRLPRQIGTIHLKLEVGVIVALAEAMNRRLHRTDPLADNSKLPKPAAACAALWGLVVRAWF